MKGFPISAFQDGDILISPNHLDEQWFFRNGQLEKITNVASEFETRKPSPDETFYRMASSMVDALMTKLDQADQEGKIKVEDYKKLRKMIESGDDEARHLVNLHLDNLGK